jgi:hypothetical protein
MVNSITIPHDRETLQRYLESKGVEIRGTKCKCPLHEDRHPSADIYQKDGVWRFWCQVCQTGGDVEDMRQLLDGRASAFANNGNGHAKSPTIKAVKSYPTAAGAFEAAAAIVRHNHGGAELVEENPYHNRDGSIFGYSPRFNIPTPPGEKQDKKFIPIHAVPGGFIVGRGDKPWPPMNLPGIVGKDRVYLTEGEKSRRAAQSCGLDATCVQGGAQQADGSDWSWASTVKEICALPDNDPTGDKFVEDATRCIMAASPSTVVKIVRLPDLPPKGDMADFCDELRDGQESESIRAEIEALARAAKPITAADAFGIEVLSVGQLITKNPELRDVLIENMLRRGETMNIIAAPKVGKSWLVLNLAVAMAIGSTWLGRKCAPGPILLLDFELHPATLAYRAKKTAMAWGIPEAEISSMFDVVSLRGKRKDLISLGPWLKSLGRGKYNAIIFDAVYRCIPPDIDENSNSDMRKVYDLVDEYGDVTDSAQILVHHTSKGNQSDKDVSWVGSGAGSISRAPDTHAILRPHQEPGVVVADCINRSFPPSPATCWALDVPLFHPRSELDPTMLAKPARKARAKDESGSNAKPVAEVWTPELLVERCISTEPQIREQVENAATAHGVSLRAARSLLKTAVAQGIAHKWDGTGPKPARYARIAQPTPIVAEVNI